MLNDYFAGLESELSEVDGSEHDTMGDCHFRAVLHAVYIN